jgi:hypothetical protein
MKICRACFKRTFDVTNKMIEVVINSKRNSALGIAQKERRGRHKPSNTRSDADRDLAVNNILSVP